MGDEIRHMMSARPTFFISDLHLSPIRPEQIELFMHFMREIAPQSGALYILGDLFEAWVGDDDLPTPFNAEITTAIKTLSDRGIAVYFMPGNRDFLANKALARATGWRMLEDPATIDLFGTRTLLSHGDLFCTDDLAYQAFRSQARSPAWQADFLSKPLPARHQIAHSIREKSEQEKAGKKAEIMDVNPSAVYEAMKHTQAQRLIHGHTHRPARHSLHIDKQACERWVLADWYETGGYLSCDSTGCRAITFTQARST